MNQPDEKTIQEIDIALLKGLSTEQSTMISLLLDTSRTLVELYDEQKKLTDIERARGDKFASLHSMSSSILTEMVEQLDEALGERDRARNTAQHLIEESMRHAWHPLDGSEHDQPVG